MYTIRYIARLGLLYIYTGPAKKTNTSRKTVGLWWWTAVSGTPAEGVPRQRREAYNPQGGRRNFVRSYRRARNALPPSSVNPKIKFHALCDSSPLQYLAAFLSIPRSRRSSLCFISYFLWLRSFLLYISHFLWISAALPTATPRRVISAANTFRRHVTKTGTVHLVFIRKTILRC